MSESSPGPRLVHVTFTGADHTVDAGALAELLGAHRPGTIELAVLGSVSKQGAERYPVPRLALDIVGLTNPDARIGFWIDLETGARARMNPGVSLNDDPPGPICFSTSRCAAVMAAVAPFLSA